MHIVDITLFYGRETGGVQTYLHAKRRYLAGVRHVRHTMVVPRGPHLQEDNDNIGIASMPFPFAPGFRLPIGRAAPVLRKLKPDLIEVGDASYLAWEALRVGRELKIPVVGFYHSDLPRIFGRRLGAAAERLVGQYVAKLYGRFDLVIAPSRSAARRLRELGLERVLYEPLGVDTDVFNPMRRDPGLRSELGLPEDTRLLIYVGRFVPEKNLPLLLHAIALLGKGYHLLAVGGDALLSAPDNVTFLPFERDRASLARLLASSDALVHAGDQETFGLAVVEAMACAVPVVGVARGGIGELIDSSTGVLAAPGDALTLATAVRQLYDKDFAQLGRNARLKMLRHFTWEKVVGRLTDAYTQLSAQGADDFAIQGTTLHAIE
ncbi:MAG: glycosyltransferase family 1 protein [Pseudomonadota bacterium]|nr:glycosyltransferase family 1 protein [Pseudomonadota bacterium]